MIKNIIQDLKNGVTIISIKNIGKKQEELVESFLIILIQIIGKKNLSLQKILENVFWKHIL